MLCQVNIFGGTLQGFIKSIDGKILILRMVDVEHKNLKKGRYTYVRDEKTESRIKKELKIYIFESHDDYMWPQGFAIADNEEEAWKIFLHHGKVKEIGLNDTDKKYYSVKTIPLERTGYSFECEN